jgi:hypothetical protein
MRPTRLCILLGIATFAATLAPAAAAQACGTSPRNAAVRYYHRIDAHRFPAAWSCLSSAARRQLGPYSRWRAGYSGIRWVHITGLRTVDQGAGIAEMSVNLRSCRRIGRGARFETFGGRWSALNGFAGWRLHNPRIHRRVSRNRVGC